MTKVLPEFLLIPHRLTIYSVSKEIKRIKVFIILELLKNPGNECANSLMTNGNNKHNYPKEAILPTVAILEAKNFKVKYDFLNFS